MARGLIWFRTDLRVHDNPALFSASKDSKDGLLAVYCLTPKTWAEHNEAACKIDFILRNLEVLFAQLMQFNIPLIILECDSYSKCPQALIDIAHAYKINALYYNKQYELNELQRDDKVNRLFKSHELKVYSYDDQLILSPGRILNQSQQAFKVFSPFKRKWWQALSMHDLQLTPLPKKLATRLTDPSTVPKCVKGFSSKVDPALWPAGEGYAKKRLKYFCEAGVFEYHIKRNFPAVDGTSRLSPYLAQGILSAKQCLNELMTVLSIQNPLEILHHQGPSVWVDEIIWREFYKLILIYYPRVSKNLPFKTKAQNLVWQNNEAYFKLWCEGKTGFPIVDAAMRQMHATGWMHNRLRMITAMFLSKILLINWQWGERYFMQHLIDGDLAANNGGWQWSASTGTDSVPYFRIFNPMTQSMKFDPDGEFIKQFCPELKSLDKKSIHQPYKNHPERITKLDYPRPIVDYKAMRQLALATYKSL